MADDQLIHEIMDNIRTLLEMNGQMQSTLKRMSVNLNKQAGSIAVLGFAPADLLPSGPNLTSTQHWTDSQSEQVAFNCIDYPIVSYSDVGIESSDENTTHMKFVRFTKANSNLGIAQTTRADFICRKFEFRAVWFVNHFGFDPGPIFVNTPFSNRITSMFDPMTTALCESRNSILRGKQAEFKMERNDNGVIEINTTILTHITAPIIKEIYNEACGIDNISWSLTDEPNSNEQMAQPQVELHQNPEYKQQDLNFAPFPRFSGENPTQWLAYTDRYSASYSIHGTDCFPYVFDCFAVEASTWFILMRFRFILTGWSDFTEYLMDRLGSPNSVTAGTATLMPHSSPVPQIGNQIEVVCTGQMLFTDNSTAPIYLAQCPEHSNRLEHGLGSITSLATDLDVALAPNMTVLVTSSVKETEFHFVPRPIQAAKSVVYQNVKRFPYARTIWAYPIAPIAIMMLQSQIRDKYLTWKGGTSTLIYYPAKGKSGRQTYYTFVLIKGTEFFMYKCNASVKEELLPIIYVDTTQLEVAEYVEISQHFWVTVAHNQMWGILINWLIEVLLNFKLLQEILLLMVTVLHNYLPCIRIPKHDMQLLGITPLLLTPTFEAFWHPKVLDLIRVSTDVYTRDQMPGLQTTIFIKLPFRLQVTVYNPVELCTLSYPHVTKLVIVQWVPNITSFAALYGHKPPNIVTFLRCNYITEESVIRTITTPLTCTTYQHDSFITSKHVGIPDQIYSLHYDCFFTMPFQFKSMLDIMIVTISDQWAPYRLVQGGDFPKHSPTSDTPTNSLETFPNYFGPPQLLFNVSESVYNPSLFATSTPQEEITYLQFDFSTATWDTMTTKSATWVDPTGLPQPFSTLHLEDKVNFKGGSNVMNLMNLNPRTQFGSPAQEAQQVKGVIRDSSQVIRNV